MASPLKMSRSGIYVREVRGSVTVQFGGSGAENAPVSGQSSEFVVFGRYQDLALAGMIGGADDTFLLHALDDRRRAVVADAKPPLDVAGRGLAVAQHDCHRLVIGIVRIVEI